MASPHHAHPTAGIHHLDPALFGLAPSFDHGGLGLGLDNLPIDPHLFALHAGRVDIDRVGAPADSIKSVHSHDADGIDHTYDAIPPPLGGGEMGQGLMAGAEEEAEAEAEPEEGTGMDPALQAIVKSLTNAQQAQQLEQAQLGHDSLINAVRALDDSAPHTLSTLNEAHEHIESGPVDHDIQASLAELTPEQLNTFFPSDDGFMLDTALQPQPEPEHDHEHDHETHHEHAQQHLDFLRHEVDLQFQSDPEMLHAEAGPSTLPPDQPVKRGRGRPKGAKNKPKVRLATLLENPHLSSPVSEPPPAPKPTPPRPRAPRVRKPRPPREKKPLGRPPKQRQGEELIRFLQEKQDRIDGIKPRRGRPRKFPGYLVREMRLSKNRAEFREVVKRYQDGLESERQERRDRGEREESGNSFREDQGGEAQIDEDDLYTDSNGRYTNASTTHVSTRNEIDLEGNGSSHEHDHDHGEGESHGQSHHHHLNQHDLDIDMNIDLPIEMHHGEEWDWTGADADEQRLLDAVRGHFAAAAAAGTGVEHEGMDGTGNIDGIGDTANTGAGDGIESTEQAGTI